MNAMDYVIWKCGIVRNAVVLKKLVNVEKQYQLRDGVSRMEGFRLDAVYTMDPDYPDNTLLVDNLFNTASRIVASARLQNFLRKQKVQHVEYLPVTILNPKGKPHSKEYAIVHPVGLIDCIDLDNSKFDWSTIVETEIDEIYNMVLKPGAIPADRLLFKAQRYPNVIYARRDLATAIDSEGLTGIRWIEVSNYRTHEP